MWPNCKRCFLFEGKWYAAQAPILRPTAPFQRRALISRPVMTLLQL